MVGMCERVVGMIQLLDPELVFALFERGVATLPQWFEIYALSAFFFALALIVWVRIREIRNTP